MIGMFSAHLCVVWAESLVSLHDVQEGVLVPVHSNISRLGTWKPPVLPSAALGVVYCR